MTKGKKEKKIKHDKIEKCRISKKDINTEEDDYAIILDCRGEIIHGVGFYKNDLLKGLMGENRQAIKDELQNKIQKQAMSMTSQLKQVMGLKT